MVRQTGRSRGCKNCRMRKIKLICLRCDENAPICRECSNAGLECSGPTLGAFFIDMTEKVKKDQERKPAKEARGQGVTKTPSCKQSKSAKSYTPQSDSATGSAAGKVKSPESDIHSVSAASAVTRTNISTTQAFRAQCGLTDRDPTHFSCEIMLPTTYTPNPDPILEQLYLSNLIASYSCPEGRQAGLHMWVTDLPQMLSSYENSTITYSTRATSMALYGRLTRISSIAFQARKCYAKCLQLQKNNIQLNSNKAQKFSCPSSLAPIAATFLLAVFESTVSSDPDGWVHHVSAAIRMLLAKGPEACQRGLGNQLFRSLRLSSVLVGMTTREPSPFDKPGWHDLPFAACEKTNLDKLVQILVQIPSCSFKVQQWEHAGSLKETIGLRRQILQQTESLLLQLDLFSELYDIECFVTAFQASFVAFFHSACLICLSYHSRMASLEYADRLRMEDHAEIILKCASFHQSAGIHSGGSFSMSFPLKIASLMAPSRYIRDQAQDMISLWGNKRGLADLFQAASPVCT